ncbi:chemotaxis protein PomA [bacterium BMS3Bbin02]|nr:chemotaxis protein PomA [bacterium BMS3Bbin02]
MTTILGIVIAMMSIVIATIMDGNSFGALIGPSSLFLVFVGSLGVTLGGFQMADASVVPKGIVVAMTGKEPEPSGAVDQLMEFAEIARKDGVLALESKLEGLDDEFMKAGLQSVVDGMDADAVREILEIELTGLDERHRPTIEFVKAMGAYAPTMGMVGTVIGLINMLSDLSDPAQLGAGMSVALLTTLYGVIFANLIFLPISAKLTRLHVLEIAYKEMILDGILAVQAGASPRMLVERLEAYLVPSLRVGHQVRAKGGAKAEAA